MACARHPVGESKPACQTSAGSGWPDARTRRSRTRLYLVPALQLLLVGALLLSAATPAAARSYTVWSTFLTVDVDGTVSGCDDENTDLDDCDAGLASDEFTYEGSYAVEALVLFVDAMNNPKLELQLDENAPSDAPLALYLDGNRFAFGDATISGQKVTWSNPGITWTDNQVVTVSLVWEGPFGASPGKPTLTGVTTGQNAPTDTTLSFTITCVSGGKALVTDFAFYAVNDSDSSDTHSWNYIVPLACQSSSSSTIVTMTGFPSRTTATTYSIRARARNRLGSRGQWSNTVSVATTANNQQVSGGGTSDPKPEGDPLTASFEKVPAKHDGESAFTLQVRLSETIGKFSRSPRASSFAVTQGRVLSVEQVGAGLWQVKVQPSSSSDVTVTLEGGRDCDDEPSGAVCTKDIRALSNTSTVTIGGPTPQSAEEDSVQLVEKDPVQPAEEPVQQQRKAPLTATFEGIPSEHDGKSAFTLKVRLSEAPGAGGSALSVASFRVARGSVKKVKSVSAGLYRVRVAPKSWRDVMVTLAGGRSCDAAGAVCTADGRALTNTATTTVSGPVRIHIKNARAREGRDASLDFAVTLNRAASHAVSVDYATEDGTATAGADYTATSGTLTFAAGETAKTVSVPVLEDAVDEGKETMRLLLSNPQGAYLRGIHRKAKGVIVNDDALQQAWLTRFGRTVGSQVTDAVSTRLADDLAPGAHATLSGQAVDLAHTGDGKALTDVLTSLAQRFGTPDRPAANDDNPLARNGLGGGLDAPSSVPRQAMTGRELLLGSSFHLAGAGGDGPGPRFAAWGRVAYTSFDGEQASETGRLEIDGDVLTGTLGMDADWGRVLAGLAVSLSDGDGRFDDSGATTGAKGDLESKMRTVSPYVRFNLSERVSAWGLGGWGTGDMTIEFDDDSMASVRPDIDMRMAAAGVRGTLMEQDEAGGMDLALKADVFFVRTESDKVPNSVETNADASRLRLALEGGRSVGLSDGAMVRPALELGVRHDDGDAETGTGVEVGGGITYANPSSGLSVEAKARVLLAHADSDYEEWGASATAQIDPGVGGRGLSFSLTSTLGVASSASERLWGAQDARAFAPDGGAFDADRSLRAEASYGMPVFAGRFTGTPNLGFRMWDGGLRDWRIGWRLTPTGLHAAGFEVNLDAMRREATDDSEQEVMLRGRMRW